MRGAHSVVQDTVWLIAEQKAHLTLRSMCMFSFSLLLLLRVQVSRRSQASVGGEEGSILNLLEGQPGPRVGYLVIPSSACHLESSYWKLLSGFPLLTASPTRYLLCICRVCSPVLASKEPIECYLVLKGLVA